jgi:ACS family hexuronate transporter-like MFS transporter
MMRSPNWKWYVCGAMLLATLLNYMDRQALPQTATELKEKYQLGDARYGEIERGFSWSFAAGSLLFGFLADRFGPRVLYPVVLTGWSLAGLLTPGTGQEWLTRHLEGPGDEPGTGAFLWLLLCRVALGLFEAGHWPCALITARQILDAKDRPLGNGLLQSGASLGAILVPFYVMAVRKLGGGWEVIFWTVGAAGLLWVPLWLALVRRGDLDGPPPPAADGQAGLSGWPLVSRVVVLAVTVSTLALSWQFLRAWLPKFLKESQGYSADATDTAVAGYYIAADVGCILSGFVVKALVRRRWGVHAARLVGFALFTLLTAHAALVPVAGPGLTVPLLMLAGAGILGLHPYYYALAQELPPKQFGLMSGALAAGAWVVVGFMQGGIGAHIEETKSYDLGLVIAGLAPVAALVTLVALWRPGPSAQG